MNCKKCNRKVSVNRKKCLYCGELLDKQPQSKKNSTMSTGNGFYVESEKVDIIDPLDLAGNKRPKVEDAFPIEQNGITIQDESRIVDYPFNGTVDKQNELSIDIALSLLAGIRDSYKQGGIKPSVYEKMVLEVLQDYTASIDDSQKINFVVNGILDSEFMSYLNDGMLNKLRGSIIESTGNKQ